jgi:hypothetical protein
MTWLIGGRGLQGHCKITIIAIVAMRRSGPVKKSEVMEPLD